MLNIFRDIFAPQSTDPVDGGSAMDPVQLATCVLLVEAAWADDEFSAAEREHIAETLKSRFHLSHEAADELLQAVHDRTVARHDLWKWTNKLNEACSRDEKRRIVEELWRVILVDGVLDAHEDYLIHKVAKLLNLTHPQLIEAKLRVRAELDAER